MQKYLLLVLLCHFDMTFGLRHLYPKVKDISSMSSDRNGRFFYFGNGTAMVNTTTVAIGTTFVTVVGLGLWSVFFDAVNKVNAAQTSSDSSDSSDSRKDIEDFEEYKRQYDEYLRQYAIWAQENGQAPTPPDARKKRLEKKNQSLVILLVILEHLRQNHLLFSTHHLIQVHLFYPVWKSFYFFFSR